MWVLALISFSESSVFPIPPDVMLVPMCLAHRERCFYFAFVCSVASVLGGVVGYLIGYYLYETVGQWIISIYGYEDAFTTFQETFQHWGLWIILIKGMTPIPYKLVAIACGIAKFDPLVFMLASIVTRAGRFYLEVALLWRYGPPIRAVVEKRLALVTWLLVGVVVGGFVLVRYVV